MQIGTVLVEQTTEKKVNIKRKTNSLHQFSMTTINSNIQGEKKKTHKEITLNGQILFFFFF